MVSKTFDSSDSYMAYFYKPVLLDDGTEVVDWRNDIYHPISNFFVDFSIAERSGTEAIKDTYDNIISNYSDDYKLLTELVLVLESKRNFYGIKDYGSDMDKFYSKLYHDAYDYVENHLKGKVDEQKYFYLVTDFGIENPWVDFSDVIDN